MTEVVLTLIIKVACAEYGSKEAKIACYERLVNCSVTGAGEIRTEVVDKCLETERGHAHE